MVRLADRKRLWHEERLRSDTHIYIYIYSHYITVCEVSRNELPTVNFEARSFELLSPEGRSIDDWYDELTKVFEEADSAAQSVASRGSVREVRHRKNWLTDGQEPLEDADVELAKVYL